MRLPALVLSISIVAAASAPTPSAAGETVSFSGYQPGTIVVKTQERRLYYVVDGARAVRYPVGVGKAGKTWTGTAYIDGKHLRPAWSPPDEIRQDKPLIPVVIASGSPSNPMAPPR